MTEENKHVHDDMNSEEKLLIFNTIITKLHDLQVNVKEIRIDQENFVSQIADAKHQAQMLAINIEEKTLPTLEKMSKHIIGSGVEGLVDKIIFCQEKIRLLEENFTRIGSLKKWVRIILIVFGFDMFLKVILFFFIRDLWRVLVR